MKRSAHIVSFCNREAQALVKKLLDKSGLKVDATTLKKCSQVTDISEHFISSTNLSSLEKSYLRDEKKDQAAIVAIQKNELDKAISLNKGDTLFFIEEDYSPESFYLKKLLFKNKVPFFSFGNILNKEHITIAKGHLDIGFNHTFLKNNLSDFHFKMPLFPAFNGKIAIEAPPDSIPVRYLYHFKSPFFLVNNLIRAEEKFFGKKKHPPIFVQNPLRPYNSYTISTRGFQIKKTLGKRGAEFENISELSLGTTVLTWSTKRWFALHQAGMRPIPLTKTLATSIFPLKKSSFTELISFNPTQKEIEKLYNFALSRSSVAAANWSLLKYQ
ncbi:MAG: hypothetical protein ACOX2F_12555 [bacterium]